MNSYSNQTFDIPIVLFIFKRGEKAAKILKHISTIKPRKIYLIADGPRYSEEIGDIEICRNIVNQAIDWNCQVIKNYANNNRGVYENIAGGAKWVFEREKYAIFLEDDNLPELSFFYFCKELLKKYQEDQRILWICGSNYEVESVFPDNASYYFTQHMMPCGWASWADKFNKYYEGDLSLWEREKSKEIISSLRYNRSLKKQDINNWNRELSRRKRGLKFDSWDYQMVFSLRIHNLLGIVPKYNQITNIGVDELSIHGGTSFDNEMTRRFCGLRTKKIEFPLIHPQEIEINKTYERKIAKIILVPLSIRIKGRISKFIRSILPIPEEQSVKDFLKFR